MVSPMGAHHIPDPAAPRVNAWRVLLIGRRPAHTLVRTGILAALCFLVFRFVLIPVFVRGESMEPTFRDGGLNMANTLVYRLRDPLPGEVVVIEMATRRTMYLKRVLATPGDTVYFQQGALFVNGMRIEEPYVIQGGRWTTPPEQLGVDEYFVAGDNRSTPWEWHTMGVVNRSRIAGRILF